MRIKHIDILRGIAALMVTLFHIAGSSGLPAHTFDFAAYGWTGVQVFFVISGFILPYSMFKTGYKVNNLGTFMLKRVVRIYPAYLIAIVINVLLSIVTHRNDFTAVSIISQLFFLNGVVGAPFLSPVLWTLAIEFQFYILIGLLFFMLRDNHRSLLLLSILVAISGWTDSAFIIRWIPFFALGILIFNLRFTELPAIVYGLATVLLMAFIWRYFGIPEVVASCVSVLFILFGRADDQNRFTRFMLWLGAISYSLYLIHWELGRTMVNVLRRVPLVEHASLFKMFAGLIFSVLAAGLMYLFIEKPSVKYSNQIKYK